MGELTYDGWLNRCRKKCHKTTFKTTVDVVPGHVWHVVFKSHTNGNIKTNIMGWNFGRHTINSNYWTE